MRIGIPTTPLLFSSRKGTVMVNDGKTECSLVTHFFTFSPLPDLKTTNSVWECTPSLIHSGHDKSCFYTSDTSFLCFSGCRIMPAMLFFNIIDVNFIFIYFWPRGMQSLNCLTRGWICAPCSGSTVSTTRPAILMLYNVIANSWCTQRFEKGFNNWPKTETF